MLTIGDMVVHPRYGPALIEEIRIIQYRDEPRRYFCLRLTQERAFVHCAVVPHVVQPEPGKQKLHGPRPDRGTADFAQHVSHLDGTRA